MKNFLSKISLAFKDPMLRARMLFVAAALIVFRLFSAIPIPGIDTDKLQELFSNNQLLGLLDIFSGGGLANLSVVMLGVGPYITGSIIMQLLTMIFPKLKALYHEEGEAGRKRFSQYSRLLTVPLAILQGIGFLILFERQGVLPNLSQFDLATNVIIVTAGSVLLMWLGELMTEFGIGNGVSLIIFAGIVAQIPNGLRQFALTFDPAQIPLYLFSGIAAVAVVYGVVYVTEAERPVPVTYAKRVRGNKVYGGVSTYLPLRVNQAGVIPIIFALSLLLFPQMVFNFFTTSSIEWLQSAASFFLRIFTNGWFYSTFYFLLVFLFTYFYTAVTFDPEAISTNLQKSGAFIPGVRPGPATAEHLGRVVTRITLVGAVFLGLIAVLPYIMQAVTQNATLAIGGTALLIVVSVVVDLFKKIEAQVSMREY
ncbi:MAG: preprotein translocase subunit SecY [Candidatus Taylorbacteria bacterium]|nr:preprotein translocase subunit SecY [Candidatus Taylorbacteria bacterium]